MVARVLITTALEETWPSKNVPVLFLGEWCRLYDRKPAWKDLDAIVANYHWDDRDKLHQDYINLQSLYEELLKELTLQLNTLHGVEYSIRYWRIIIGPWLGYFTQILFDRWAMLKQVIHDHEIAEVRVLDYQVEQLVPNDMAAFCSMFIHDEWNESIYGQILEHMEVPIKRISHKHDEASTSRSKISLGLVNRCERMLGRVASTISNILCRESEYFFISSYLGLKQDLTLQAKLGQVPKVWRSISTPPSTLDLKMRQWHMSESKSHDDFTSLARTLIPKHIPKTYLEGYRELASFTENMPWPQSPKLIFTSNAYSSDDVFKTWAAKKVESGIPMIIGQHGGCFGMTLWAFFEEHQIAIADRFLTWGWTDPKQISTTPIGNLKGFGKTCEANNSGVALMVEMTMPRQSYHMYSVPVGAGQWQDYFEEQCRFVKALPANLQNQLIVRLYSHDYRYSQEQRWKVRFPELHLDNGDKPIDKLLKKTRIYISTYNATTYLESLSLNFPTIMFWNLKHWELRDSAIPYFEKLKSVGIYHETPEGAARQMAAIWDDVPGWWQNADLQSVRKDFCQHYARIPDKPLDIMEKLFRKIASNRNVRVQTDDELASL